MHQKPHILIFPSYLHFIENSLGSHQYRNLLAEIDGKHADVLRDGKLSCAFFVSSVLHQFQLIDRPHATVDGTVTAAKTHGWKPIHKEKIGCVLVWESKTFGLEEHKHIGFFVGDGKAISHSATKNVPTIHDWKFTDSEFGERKIITMYWHDALAS